MFVYVSLHQVSVHVRQRNNNSNKNEQGSRNMLKTTKSVLLVGGVAATMRIIWTMSL